MRTKSIVAAALSVVMTAFAAPAVTAEPLPKVDEGRRGSTTLDGIEVVYYEYGPSADEAPTMVLSSGWPGSSMFFAQRARDFAARGLHVIRYDQRGSGASGHPQDPAAYSLPALAREFGAVIDAAAPGHKVNVFGSGFAMFVASEYTTVAPGRISSLTSVDAPSADLAFDSLNRKSAEADVGNDPVLKARVAAQRAALSYLFYNADTGSSQTMAENLRPLHAGANSVYAAAAGDLAALQKYGADNYPLFATEDTKWGTYKYQWMVKNRTTPVHTYLDVPQLRVYQTDFDPITTSLLTDGLAERTPNLRYVTIPATRLAAADLSPIGQQLVDGALDAVRETPQ